MNLTINTSNRSRLSPQLLTVVIFMLVMPIVKPDSFRRIAVLDLFFDLWSMLSAGLICLIALCRFIEKKWKPSLALIGVLGLNVWLQFATIINSQFSISQFKTFVSIMTVTLIVDVFMRNHRELISALMIVFELLIYSNFLTFLLFPHGMYSDGLYSTNWLMGYDNSQIKFFVCGAVIACLYKSVTSRKRRANALLLIIVASILFTKVFTALVGLAIVLIVLIFNHRERFKAICKPEYYLFFAAIVFAAIVLNDALLDKMDFITQVTGKNATLTTRFDIWARTLEMTAESPIIGKGWNPVEVRVVEYMNPFATHAHDTYLEYLYQGGLIALALYSLILVMITQRLTKCENNGIKQFCSAVLLAFLLMSIFEAYVFPIVFMMIMLMYHCKTFQCNSGIGNLICFRRKK